MTTRNQLLLRKLLTSPQFAFHFSQHWNPLVPVADHVFDQEKKHLTDTCVTHAYLHPNRILSSFRLDQ